MTGETKATFSCQGVCVFVCVCVCVSCVWMLWHNLNVQLCAGAPYCLLPFTFFSAESKQEKSCTCEYTDTHVGLQYVHVVTVMLSYCRSATVNHLYQNNVRLHSETKVLSLRDLIIAPHITSLPAAHKHTRSHTHT